MSAIVAMMLSTVMAVGSPVAQLDERDDFDEPLLPFVPQSPPSEEEQAKVTSAALYAHGRLLYQRQDHLGALRRFQRAWRYNPEADWILPQIVFLAHRLGRPDEAAAYALIAAERTEVSSPSLLRQLALQLSAQHQWTRALALFEKSLRGPQEVAPEDGQTDLATLVVHLELGRLYFLTGDFVKSAEHFVPVRDALQNPERLAENPSLEKALLGQPERSYRMLGESFLQAGRFDDAEAMFRKACEGLQDEQQRGLLDFQLARIAAKRGSREAALGHLDDYFTAAASTAGTQPYELLAELLSESLPDARAAEQQLTSRLEKLEEADPNNASLLYYLADRDRRAQRWAEAESRFEKLLVLEPTLDVYAGLVDIHRRQRDGDKLLDVCGLAVAKGSTLQDLSEMLGDLAEDEALARELIARMRKRREDDDKGLTAGALAAAASLALDTQDDDTAQTLFDASLPLLEASARPEFLLDWGLALLLDEQYPRAAAVFRRVLAEPLPSERELACYFYLTRSLALAGEIETALEVARKAAERQPDSPRLQAQTGWVLYYAKRYAEAEKDYLALLKRFDDQPAAEFREAMRDARLVLSNICVQLDRMPEAEEWLEQILDESPEDVGALNDLGYLWTEQAKNLARALAMVQQAVEAEPDNAAYRDSLGWAYYQLGRYQEAVVELEKASAGDDPDGVILDHLGDAHLKLNQTDKAIAAWQRAVQAFRDESEAPQRKATQEKIDRYKK
jgi:tetratricopeptide (TPR) repeat protein